VATGADPAKSIAAFLIALARDRDLLKTWEDGDSHARRHQMDDFGLNPEQQAVIVLGDLKLIQDYLDYEYSAGLIPSLGPDDASAAHGGTTMVVTYRPPPAPPPTYAPSTAPKVRRIPTY
jgi:hypothetical protein